LILRRHQEEGVYVLDFALRSWPPREPVCIRWNYPQWERAADLDPSALWTGRKPKKDAPAAEEWNAERLAALCTAPMTPAASVLLRATNTGLSRAKASMWLTEALHKGLLREFRGPGKGGAKLVSPPP
jgi:hypothetical protein